MTTILSPQEAVERALALAAGERGIDGSVAIVDEASSANVRWANNTLTTNGFTRDSQLTVIATAGAKTGAAVSDAAGGPAGGVSAGGVSAGVVSRSALTADEVADVVASAVRAARDNPAADDARPLVEPEALEASGALASPELHEWADPAHETSAAVFASFASSLASAVEQARAADRLLFGFAEHSATTTWVATSTGLRLRHDQPTGRCELNAKSPDFARSAWAGVGTKDFTDVDAAALADELGKRLRWQERRIDLEPGRYETLLPPGAVADLLIYLYWSAGARDAHDGQTVFSRPGGGTRVGERLSDKPLTLMSDPTFHGLECDPFVVTRASSRESSVFDNGLPLGRTEWIRDGELSALLQTRHSADLTGLPATPPIDNLVLSGRPGPEAGGAGVADMVASSSRALLLTCLWYIRPVDPQTLLLTGLTRDGVYLVEGGEVVGAVNNFRFNESPVDMLSRIEEVGATVRCLPREWNDYFTRSAMPPLRVAGFNMSTVSKAS